jgi:hypothetical protein
MQAPLLAQPDKGASLQRDRAIWADGCIGCWLRGPISWSHTVPSAQIARSRTRDLISASLGLREMAVLQKVAYLPHYPAGDDHARVTYRQGHVIAQTGQPRLIDAYCAIVWRSQPRNELSETDGRRTGNHPDLECPRSGDSALGLPLQNRLPNERASELGPAKLLRCARADTRRSEQDDSTDRKIRMECEHVQRHESTQTVREQMHARNRGREHRPRETRCDFSERQPRGGIGKRGRPVAAPL